MIEDNIMKKIESVDQQFNKFDIEEPAPFNGMIYRGGSDHHSIEDDPEHVDIERYFRTLIMGNRDEGRRTGLPQQPESSPASRSTSSAQPQWVFDPLERIPSAPSVLFHPQQPLSMDGNVFATRTQSTSSTRTNTSESKRPRRAASANDGSDMWDSGVDADDKPTRAQRRTARRQKERDLVKSLDALIPPAGADLAPSHLALLCVLTSCPSSKIRTDQRGRDEGIGGVRSLAAHSLEGHCGFPEIDEARSIRGWRGKHVWGSKGEGAS
eukprot:753474-Hanusia_phi.AAC.6